MIIPQLVKYYERLLEDGKVAPLGLEDREVHYAIVISDRGEYIKTLSFKDDKDRGKIFRAPQSVIRSSGISANLLCDNMKYVAGTDGRGLKCRRAFVDRIKLFRESVGNSVPELDAIVGFYDDPDKGLSRFISDDVFEKVEPGNNITFMIDGHDATVMEATCVVEAVISQANEHDGKIGTCSITGEKDIIVKTHGKIKGIFGCQSSGAVLVGFNADSFVSHGKSQGDNAPVGKYAENAYVTAMNYLLKKDNGHKIGYGENSMTLVFWSEGGQEVESILLKIAGYGNGDDVSDLEEMLKSVIKNGNPHRVGGKFYLLGLKPAAARIGISMFYDGDVSEMKAKMVKYFDDTEVVGCRKSSIISLLSSTVKKIRGKSVDVRGDLISDTLMSIINGTPYPRVVLNDVVHRCFRESHVTPSRASLIKACLINSAKNNQERRPKVSLDKENENSGYLLGRLLATVENLQRFSMGKDLNKTIKDQLYKFMCTRPQLAFDKAMGKSSYYLKKATNRGGAVYYDKIISEIVEKIDSLPVMLDSEDRAMFAIGYYHQRQDFFTPKKEKEEGGKSND